MTDWFREEWLGQGSALALALQTRLHCRRSAYQSIEVYQTQEFGRLLTLDGMVMLTGRDHFIYHEMLAHPALMTHPQPRRIAIVGGGDCGLLTEVLKHDCVASVIQVELDREVTEVALAYFPEFAAAPGDARVRLEFGNGVDWIGAAASSSLDVLLVDSTDPVGPAAQLFEPPFLSQCQRVLEPQGVLALQSESPLFHTKLIIALHQRLRHAGFGGVATLTFPQCTYPSGWWSVTLAGSHDWHGFRHASAGRSVATRYYNAAIHAAALALPEFVRQQLFSDLG